MTAMQLVATTVCLMMSAIPIILELKSEQNMRRLFYELLYEWISIFGLYGSSPFSTKTDTPPLTGITPTKRLPSLLRYMSETRKSTLRATYAREIALFPPGAVNLPLTQRFLTAPITLSGPDGAVNVALRPLSAQIGLGYEHPPEPTPCPTPCLSTYAHGQADVRATLQGAIAVLEALVRRAVDEEWLNASAIKSKLLSTPRRTRAHAQWEDPLVAPKITIRSCTRIRGSKVENARGMDSSCGLVQPYSKGSTKSGPLDTNENTPEDIAGWFERIK